jgi:hypothetical protein
LHDSGEPTRSVGRALLARLLPFLLILPAARGARAQAADLPARPEAAAADSLAYEAKKRQILEGAPDVRLSAVLEAAEELAREGFWAEAVELIYDLEDTAWAEKAEDFLAEDTAPALPAAPAPKPAPWGWAALRELRSYVRSGFEYDDWDENPFGGEIRAKLEWLPADGFLERVTPTFAGSDRRAYAGLAARGSAFGRMLKLDAEGLAEKKLWQAYGDSLDRISLQGLAELGTRPLGKPVSFVLPLRGEIERYREDRLGLLSRQSFGAAPAVEAVSRDWRRSLLVSWDLRRYDFPTSASSGFLRNGPSALANWYGDRFTLEGEAQYLDDRYRRSTSMFRSRAWEARAAAFVRPWSRLKAGLRLFHNGELSSYRDTLRTLTPVLVDTVLGYATDTLQARFDLSGRVSTVQPVITVEWAAAYSASLSLAYTRGWYPIIGSYGGKPLSWPQFIDESYSAWKPEATFSVLSKRLFLNLTLGYEMHAPSPSEFYFQGPSRGAGAGGHCSWKLSPFLEVDFSGLWRKRLDGRSTPGQVQDMVSLSGGLISRFR